MKKEIKQSKTKKKTLVKPKPATKTTKYYQAVGRRKEAVARVRLFASGLGAKDEKKDAFIVNDKPLKDFFPTTELQEIVKAPLEKLKSANRFKVSIKVKGGGVKGQAEAVRHGLARALVSFDGNFSKKLKKAGFLTRDARVKERKKYGLKKARRAPQWSKR